MLSERGHIVKLLAPGADAINGDPATDVVNMEGHDRLTILVYHAGGTTGKFTMTVEECTDASGNGATAIAFNYRKLTTGVSDAIGDITAATASGVQTTAAESTVFEIEVNSRDLSDGSNFVRLQLTEDVDDPVNCCVIGILHGSRYQGETEISALA